LSQGKSPDWYEWIVPGVAMWVMEEDNWVDNPPEWSKLTWQAGFICQKVRWIPLPEPGTGLILEFKSAKYQIA